MIDNNEGLILELVTRDSLNNDLIFDLVNGADNVKLVSFAPNLPKMKRGGVYQESPFSHGRDLVFQRYDNVKQQIKIRIHGDNPKAVYDSWERLQSYLFQARDYGEVTQSTPVALRFKYRYGKVLYARIVAAEFSRYPDMANYSNFQKDGKGRSFFETTLNIEHGIPTSLFPGTSENLLLRDPSTGGDTTDGVFINNAGYGASPTGYFTVYLRSGQAAVAEQVSGDYPKNLVAHPPPTYDSGTNTYYVLFGGTNGGALHNIIFDIQTPVPDGTTVEWEYWRNTGDDDYIFDDGNDEFLGEFFPLYVINDETEGFTNTGRGGIFFRMNDDHEAPPEFSDTASAFYDDMYWIRATIIYPDTSSNGTPTLFSEPYTADTNYLQIPTNGISGDLPALGKAQIRVKSVGTSLGVGGSPYYTIQRVIVGGAQTSLVSGFRSRLYMSDSQPSSVSISYFGSMVADGNMPSGYVLNSAVSSATERSIVSFNITNPEYYQGEFRLFARITQRDGELGDVMFKGEATGGFSDFSDNDWVIPKSLSGSFDTFELLDLGSFKTPEFLQGDDLHAITVRLSARRSFAATTTINFTVYDLVLIPISELHVDTQAQQESGSGITLNTHFIEIDSTKPNQPLRATSKFIAGERVYNPFLSVTGRPFEIKSKEEFRLFFLFAATDYVGLDPYWRSSPFETGRVKIFVNEQHYSFPKEG